MKILKGFMIIFLSLFLGEVIRSIVDFPIPPVVYGMVILLIALFSKLVKVEDVESVGNGLLDNLGFLFVPITSMLIDQMELLGDNILAILAILFISLVLTIAVTGKVVELVQRRVMRND
ncbi:MAG: CidA/LrgA family protein [Tissierellia bacterium]|nr:CidA/LrgA family protein [Tissierellia bacterium]